MKKYIKHIAVLIAVLTSLTTFSQKLPKNFKEKIHKEYSEISKKDIDQELKMDFNQYFSYRKNTYLSEQKFYKLIVQQKSANDLCSNGTFENGSINPSDWNFTWGGGAWFNYTNISLQTTFINSGSFAPANHNVSVHHKAVTSGPDPTIGNLLNTVWNNPSGNTTSVRLGNKGRGKGYESMAKLVTITPNNASLSFAYAMVLQNPHNPHSISRVPSFGVNIIDAGDNTINYNTLVDLGGGNNVILSIHPSLLSGEVSDRQVMYKPWDCVTIDLSSLIGKTVIIEFKNKDCGAGGHWAYSYIDNICLGCNGNGDGGGIKLGEKSDCGLPGKICIDYTVPNGNNPSVKLQLDLIQNGVIVNTLNSPQFTSDGSYCFNLPTTISGINTNLGGFDYKVTGLPKLGNFTLTPKYIGNGVSGIDGATNNDYAIKCPVNCDDCCKTKLAIWNVHGTPNPLVAIPKQVIGHIGSGVVELTKYSMSEETFKIHQNSNVPITELSVNITDIDFEYNYDSCSTCKDNPALWASLVPGQNTVGGLSLPSIAMIGGNINQHKNIREIVWENPNGVMLTNGTKFKVKYMLPEMSDIPCCVSQVKVCVKISWKDANCNMCSVDTCSIIQIGNKK